MAYYSVRYVSDGSVQLTELWSVPPSSTPLEVADVRIDWPPAGAGAGAQTGILIEDVEGLREELDIRAVKGLAYVPSRAAVIGATGELEAATGDLSDCVRVDGTSGPCGAPAAGFVDGETPAGAVNGVNTSFTLSGTPDPAISVVLYRNGILQKLNLDFTMIGNVVNFAAAATPQTGDMLLTSYRVEPALTALYGFVDAETPAGIIDGVNTSFTLAGTPNPKISLLLYRNGALQRQGLDYSLTGNVINFIYLASVPQTGDNLLASYRIEE